MREVSTWHHRVRNNWPYRQAIPPVTLPGEQDVARDGDTHEGGAVTAYDDDRAPRDVTRSGTTRRETTRHEMTRREMLAVAASIGATMLWPRLEADASGVRHTERRDLYPQGVASGDPRPDSVLLWTRRPPAEEGTATRLVVEVATDAAFQHVVSRRTVPIGGDNDWTCRVLAAGLEPRRVYWYRFTDERGNGSRIGRTITAPAIDDPAPMPFAFVSCQNVNLGACNAYRRMIWEDERASTTGAEPLGFVLHLGDFVYEIVWYPEDKPHGMYDRSIHDVVRYRTGEKHGAVHVPTTVDDYRTLYRGYLADPDLQDARARWPFVYVWDNHEFSWRGWQSQQNFGAAAIPAETRKVAANQAWFEYQPARVRQPAHPHGDRFVAPRVRDVPLTRLDEHGLGLEPDNLAAIRSLEIFRTMRWGRHVELVITDNRSFRSEPVLERPDAAPLAPKDSPIFAAQDVVEVLDAGRAYRGGHPPATLTSNGATYPNPRADSPPQSMLGAAQKRWLLDQLRASKAQWKLWGNSVAMLDLRSDLHRLPPPARGAWPSDGYAIIADDDWSAYRTERNEILNAIEHEGITGVVTIAGDRHAFNAGVLSPTLPPEPFEPVAAEFVVGSISAPGIAEGLDYAIKPDDPLRAIYLHDQGNGARPAPAINLSLMHGVHSSLELARTNDFQKAVAASNPEVAPHLSFVDMGGHGYAIVRADADAVQVEFVCIPRPVERSGTADGGPVLYRVTHRVAHWARDGRPVVERTASTGTLPLVR